jgi:hypothetical protein
VTARTWRPDGPGSFQAPPDVQRVRDRTGRLWSRNQPRTRWTSGSGPHIRWRVLVDQHGPLAEETQ